MTVSPSKQGGQHEGAGVFDLNPAQLQQLSAALLEMLDQWGVEAQDQVLLLGLPARTRPRQLSAFRNTCPLPDTPEIRTRIEHLMGIADALRTTFPMNDQMGALWLSRPHRRFNQRAPLRCMLEDGLDGLLAVRRHLDCAYDWQIDDQSHQN